MDNQKQKPLWEDDLDISDAPLRRPNSPTFTTNLNSTTDSIQSLNLTGPFGVPLRRPNDPDFANNHNTEREVLNVTSSVNASNVKQSKLSAEAKEWYPASYKKPSAQDRLLKYKQKAPQQESNSQSNGICSNDNLEHSDVSVQLQGYINTLIEDPGQFDNLLDSFVDALAPYFGDLNIVDCVAKLIFTEAITEPNFRYSAARICRILEEQCPLFRTSLHLFATNQIEKDVPPTYEYDLALTLAELFALSNCDNLYGHFVVKSIEKIVSRGNRDSIKCVCQVLKLTGAALDAHHRTKMNSIFNQLELVKPAMPELINLIDYVISLRASQWGEVDSVSPDARCSPQSSNHPDGPIFYGPDGQELSEEEKQFLSENCVDFYSEEFVDSDPDELFDPFNEMDDEVHAAFLEFTKGNKE